MGLKEKEESVESTVKAASVSERKTKLYSIITKVLGHRDSKAREVERAEEGKGKGDTMFLCKVIFTTCKYTGIICLRESLPMKFATLVIFSSPFTHRIVSLVWILNEALLFNSLLPSVKASLCYPPALHWNYSLLGSQSSMLLKYILM